MMDDYQKFQHENYKANLFVYQLKLQADRHKLLTYINQQTDRMTNYKVIFYFFLVKYMYA